MKLKWKCCWKSIICVVLGIVIWGYLKGGSGQLIVDGRLERNTYGEGDKEYEVLVRGLDEDENVPLNVIVGEQRYSEERATAAFEEEYQRLSKAILGENIALDQIRYPLRLQENREHNGIRFSWESSDAEILDENGRILLSYKEQDEKKVILSVDMNDGVHTARYDMELTVFPPFETLEAKIEEFAVFLQKEDQEQQENSVLVLPKEYNGKNLKYQRKESNEAEIALFMGIVAAVAVYFQNPMKEREEKKKREQQMMLDYAEIVSKLLVFLGAGFTVRGAWEKIVTDYERKRQREELEKRFAYEEMKNTYAQITSGMYEAKAYGAFGRRCGLSSYIKLGCLLEQNLRTGSKNLRRLLEEEMETALEQRKQTALKLGEEASTKLIIPMVMMLGIVMIIIVVPAFMAL